MFKQILSLCGIFTAISFSAFADVYEIPESGFTKYVISFDDAEKIAITFEVTAQLDTCNSHGLLGDLLPISENYYLADLQIMSTQMYCSDRTLQTEVFTKTFEVDGSWITVLVPKNAVVSASVIK